MMLAKAAPGPRASERSEPSNGFEAKAPVCGMVVEAKDSPYAFTGSDRQYLFCSRQCLNRFLARMDGRRDTPVDILAKK